MKIRLVICLVVFISNSLNCQTEIDSLNFYDTNIRNQNFGYEKINDSISLLNFQLNRKNELLETTLNTNSNIFNGISSYLTAITIILAVISILVVIILPVINYFIVIRPNKELATKVNTIEQGIEGKFEVFYKNYEKNKFKNLINDLNDNESYLNLVDFMNSSTYSDYDNNDLNQVVNFLKSDGQIDDTYSLHSILSNKFNDISTLFYKESFELEPNENRPYAIKYLVNIGKNDFFLFMKKEIITSINGHIFMLDILEYAKYYYLNFNKKSKLDIGENIIMKYFNNEEICKSLKSKKIPENRESIFSEFSSDLLKDTTYEKHPFIKETLYFNLFLKDKIQTSTPPSFLAL